MHIVAKPDICKQLCEYQGYQIKIEVNQAKSGIIGGDVVRMPDCLLWVGFKHREVGEGILSSGLERFRT